jgi:hypothetical protein
MVVAAEGGLSAGGGADGAWAEAGAFGMVVNESD